jgi:hypothetical protein
MKKSWKISGGKIRCNIQSEIGAAKKAQGREGRESYFD